MSTELRVGDWVTINAQVTEVSEHRGEVAVELFSKTDQYTALVRLDAVTLIDPPPTALRCTHLWERGDGLLARCWLHDEHAGEHKRGNLAWDSEHSHGYWEEK